MPWAFVFGGVGIGRAIMYCDLVASHPIPTGELFYSVDEVAHRCGVGPWSVYRWMDRGVSWGPKLRYRLRLWGGKVRRVVSVADLDEFLQGLVPYADDPRYQDSLPVRILTKHRVQAHKGHIAQGSTHCCQDVAHLIKPKAPVIVTPDPSPPTDQPPPSSPDQDPSTPDDDPK